MKYTIIHNKLKIIGSIIVFLIGLFILVIGAQVTYHEVSFCKAEKITKGVIKNIEVKYTSKSSDCYVTVEYCIDNYVYTNKIMDNSSSLKKGMEIDVYYNPENHSNIRLAKHTYITCFFVDVIGSVMITFGIVSFLKSRKREKQKKWLIENGIKIMAEIKVIKLSYSLFLKEKPKEVICVAVHSVKNNDTVYKSEKFFSNQKEYVGKQVTVYVNVLDKNEYYVDVQHIDKINAE